MTQLIRHSVNCIDCQTLGPYFPDLEEDPDLSQELGLLFRAEFGSPTPATRISDERDMKRLGVPYIGYGSCKHSQILLRLPQPLSAEIDDVIQYYLSTLRVDCRHSLVSQIRGWLTTKLRFLAIQPDLSLKVLTTSPLLKYGSLTSEEYEMLLSALFFYKYTVLYLQEKTLGHREPSRQDPSQPRLSRRMRFLSRLFLEVAESIRDHFPRHVIKLTRSLSRMLKNKFYALLQTLLDLEFETKHAREKGDNDKEGLDGLERRRRQNYEDRVEVMALKEFLLYGLGPTLKSNTPTQTAFTSFFLLNAPRIKLLVLVYGFDQDNLKLASESE